jgi:crossover junction endodeoxyribonuclease RusA
MMGSDHHELAVQVFGQPIPQGSKRAIINRHTNRAVVIESAGQELGLWREAIARAVRDKISYPTNGPVGLSLSFTFRRPSTHIGTKGLKSSAPIDKVTRPDVDKLARAVLDALTGVLYFDDSQVVFLSARKSYGYEGGALGVYIIAEWDE